MNDDPSPVRRAFAPVVPGERLAATAHARAIVERARHEAEAIRAEALDAVHVAVASARARVLAETRAEAARRIAELDAVLAARRAELEVAAVEAVLAVAERVWREVPDDRSAAAARVAAELARDLDAATVLRARVHPKDANAVRTLGVAVVEDGGLAPGDCVLECTDGVRDARASVRARVAIEALASALGRAAPEGGA